MDRRGRRRKGGQRLRIEALLDTEHDFPAAAQQVRTLMFIERFKSDIAERIDAQAEAGQ